MSKINDVLERILPLSARRFKQETGDLRQMMERQAQQLEQGQQQLKQGQQQLEQGQQRLEQEQQLLLDAVKQLSAEQCHQAELLSQGYATSASQIEEIREILHQAAEEQKQLASAVEKIRLQSTDAVRYASEAVWAETFNNAIAGSPWLTNTAFSPGHWAIGYPALYAMYRILNEARPARILELGLGQSTRMIAQYAAAHEDVSHQVVEHDPDWIAFFQNDFCLPENSRIVKLDREMMPYKEAEAVRVFKNFRETFSGQRFDFIFVDAPLGGDMKQYARIDVLGLLPECLTEDFVIMIDDANRSGEAHTIMEMRKLLDEAGILYKCGRYSGKKEAIVICAEHKGFLTSM